MNKGKEHALGREERPLPPLIDERGNMESTQESINAFLKRCNCAKYIKKIVEEHDVLDVEGLRDLSNDGWNKIGLPIGAQNRILKALHPQAPPTQGLPGPTTQVTPIKALAKLARRPVTEREGNILLDVYPQQAQLLLTGAFNERNATLLLNRIKNYISTKSNIDISETKGYVFDGPLSGSVSQGGNLVCLVFKNSLAYCAKIGRPRTIKLEAQIGRKLQEIKCPTVMPIIDDFKIDSDRYCHISPLYGAPLTVMLIVIHKELKQITVMFEEMLVNVILCTLAAVKAFSMLELCHCDIKPSNLMLSSWTKGMITLIDFGATTKYGEFIREETMQYSLDAERIGSLQFDLTCLASTIYHVMTGDAPPSNCSREDLKLLFTQIPSTFGRDIALMCLESGTSIDELWEHAVDTLPKLPGIVEFSSIWPEKKK